MDSIRPEQYRRLLSRRAIRTLCYFGSLVPLISCVGSLIFFALHEPYFQRVHQPVGECKILQTGEIIRLYDYTNELFDNVYSITYQAPEKREKEFYHSENVPHVIGIECQEKAVTILKGGLNHPHETIPLSRVRNELIREPLCYASASNACLDFGIFGDVGGYFCMVMPLVLVLGNSIFMFRLARRI